MDEQTALDELKIIESYIPDEFSCQEIYRKLAKRHSYVNYLITKHVAYEVAALRNVKGADIDAMLDKRRIIPGLSNSMSVFIYRKSEHQMGIFDRLSHRLVDNIIFFNDSDIHLIPLYAQNLVDVNGGGLVTSTDSKYAKSTD